jgi:multicomponent Na+:H+ antiporter subunit E
MRLVLFAGLWWVIAGGAAGSWLIGVPAVAAAAWASVWLARGPRVRPSLLGFLRFIPFFLWGSLLGGMDVALRTLSPTPRVDPVFARYRTRLTQPAARVFFANCASLLPGTLAANIDRDEIELHVLSRELDLGAELGRLERAVARIFPHDEEPQDD